MFLNYKGFLLFDLDPDRVYVSRDVKFFPHKFPFKQSVDVSFESHVVDPSLPFSSKPLASYPVDDGGLFVPPVGDINTESIPTSDSNLEELEVEPTIY